MKYIKPDLDIIEFDKNVWTTQVGASDGVSTGSNENGNTDLGDTDLWN